MVIHQIHLVISIICISQKSLFCQFSVDQRPVDRSTNILRNPFKLYTKFFTSSAHSFSFLLLSQYEIGLLLPISLVTLSWRRRPHSAPKYNTSTSALTTSYVSAE